MSRGLRWIAYGTIGGTAILLGGACYLALSTSYQMGRSLERHKVEERVLGEVHKLLPLLIDVETGRRGFVLMNEEAYLEPYHAAVPEIEETFRDIEENTKDPDLLALVEQARPLAMERIRLARESIDLMRVQGEVSPEQRAISPQGKELSDKLRLITRDMQVHQQDKIRDYIEDHARWSALVGNVSLVTTIFSLLLLAAVFRYLLHAMRHSEELEQANAQANEQLSGKVEELRARNMHIVELGRLSDMLQVCTTVDEAYGIVGEHLGRVFSARAGAICLTANSRDLVGVHCTWGQSEDIPSHFAPTDCWALRRGRIHKWHSDSNATKCGHIKDKATPHGTICFPMVAQGETMGLLFLDYEVLPAEGSEEELILQACAEQVALALANLKLRDTLKQQATRDMLSGLFNRRYFDEALEVEFRRAQRNEGGSVALILLDVDHFKKFNDTYGHAAGDAVIREMGHFLAHKVRGGDIACRYGGEEFAVILPGANTEQALRRAEELCEGIRGHRLQHEGRSLGVITISLGVASFPADTSTTASLIALADEALYAAKQQGRNRAVAAGGNGGESAHNLREEVPSAQ